MVKKRPQVIILLFVILLNVSAIVSVTSFNKSLLGVASGDFFNMEVKESPRDSIQSDRIRPDGFTRPDGINPKDGSSNIGGIEIDDFTLAPLITPIPSTGVVFSIEVLTTPNGTELGLLESTIKGSKTKFNTDFSYGSPVVFTDWNGWIEKLDDLENNAANLYDEIITITVDITTNSALYFQTKIMIDIAIPEEMQEFVQEITVTQHVRYDKNTGIQDLFILETTTVSLVRGERNQISHLEFSTKDLTPPDFPTQLILIILAGITLIGGGIFMFQRRKSQVLQLQQDPNLAHRNTMKKEKTQLQDIQAKIAEIEKMEQESLKQAEDTLKEKKTFKRRRY